VSGSSAPTLADVVIVGGGPAGAALAWRLARRGIGVAVLERQPAWRWRAGGVFSTPLVVRELHALGVGAEVVARVARPIPRMWVESARGSRFALTYGADRAGASTAVGLDRSTLDPLLLAGAERAGACVVRGASVTDVERGDGGWIVRVRDGGGDRAISARIVVGADGIRSLVARSLRVARSVPLPRVGLTFHVSEPEAGSDVVRDARIVVLPGAYVGLAPVPGGRVNVGIVLAPRRAAELRVTGARTIADGILAEAGFTGRTDPLDHIAGVSPIAHRVARRGGPGWLLVGDAAGFLDPFTGEGLHRALVSARLADAAVGAALAGRSGALGDYDAAMDRRFRAKDLVSWVVQGFVAEPRLFEYAAARLAARATVRDRMGRLMGDLVPASGAFDPRLLAALLRP
jgi:flavin-dependent dehydrogenase